MSLFLHLLYYKFTLYTTIIYFTFIYQSSIRLVFVLTTILHYYPLWSQKLTFWNSILNRIKSRKSWTLQTTEVDLLQWWLILR